MRQHLSSYHVRAEPDTDKKPLGSPWIGAGRDPKQVEVGPVTVQVTDPVTGKPREVIGFAARGRAIPPEVLETLRMISNGRVAMLDDTTLQPIGEQPPKMEEPSAEPQQEAVPMEIEQMEYVAAISQSALVAMLAAAIACGIVGGVIAMAILHS